MKKRRFTMLPVLLLAVCCSACGGKAPETPAEQPAEESAEKPAEEPVKLIWWFIPGEMFRTTWRRSWKRPMP
ncbi:MAG: hypothetical protein K6E83_12385 [Clostridium sp.]|nr:hypothetical protein [Clostridium sp.]